jgi:rod shape-determining protein MreC
VKQSKIWVWLLVLSLGALLFWRTGVRDFAREAVYPWANARTWLERTVGVRFRAVFSRVKLAALASRNAMLERDVARLLVCKQEAEALDAEIVRLRGLLGYTPPVSTRWLAAPVLSRGGTTAVWQSLRVGKGSQHGVREGDPVVVPDGLVGRVTDVSAHTSEVMLITDPNSRVACELDVPGESVGVVRGILYGGGATAAADPRLTLLYVVDPLRLRYLAREFDPAPRTRVVTSGLGQTFPKGLTVGYVLESRLEPNKLSREAAVMPAVDLASVHDVFILSARGVSHAP